MNREDIFRMAQEVELINKDYDFAFLNKFTDKVERFAALVATNDTSQKRVDKTSESVHESQRTWVGLTDEEVNTIYEQAEVLVNDSWVGNGTVGLMFHVTLYKMFEAKLKEKNT